MLLSILGARKLDPKRLIAHPSSSTLKVIIEA
jgi:hypothetical protein